MLAAERLGIGKAPSTTPSPPPPHRRAQGKLATKAIALAQRTRRAVLAVESPQPLRTKKRAARLGDALDHSAGLVLLDHTC